MKLPVTVDAVQPSLNATADITHVTDADGVAYLFKAAEKPFRAESEDATGRLAALAGFPVAESVVGKLEGVYGQFQRKVKHLSTLEGVAVSDLSLAERCAVARSHVFDWAVHNDDAAGRNFLRTPETIVPIDLSRAFAAFGSAGMALKLGSLSDRTHVYYNDLYAFLKGDAAAEREAVAIAALDQACVIEMLSDDEWAAIIASGIANRPSYKYSIATGSAHLIELALARKHQLIAGFDQFWSAML